MSDSKGMKQVTDAVSQVDVQVVGSASAMAMAPIYLSKAHAMGIMFEQAVSQQHLKSQVSNSVTAKTISQVYHGKMGKKNQQQLLNLLTNLNQ